MAISFAWIKPALDSLQGIVNVWDKLKKHWPRKRIRDRKRNLIPPDRSTWTFDPADHTTCKLEIPLDGFQFRELRFDLVSPGQEFCIEITVANRFHGDTSRGRLAGHENNKHYGFRLHREPKRRKVRLSLWHEGPVDGTPQYFLIPEGATRLRITLSTLRYKEGVRMRVRIGRASHILPFDIPEEYLDRLHISASLCSTQSLFENIQAYVSE